MIIREMHFDQLRRFGRCLVDNGDNTFSIRITTGATGTNFRSSHRSDTMKAFDKTIQNDSVRTI